MGQFSGDVVRPAAQPRSMTPGLDHRRPGVATPSSPAHCAGSVTPMPGTGALTPAASPLGPFNGVKTKVARWAGATKTSSLSTHWSSNNAISLAAAGHEHLWEGKVETLDRSCWKSVHAALEALNSGALVVEAGYCIIFSESCKLYFILRRDDKELEALTALPPELFRSHALATPAKDNNAPAGHGALDLTAAAVTPQFLAAPSKPPLCPSVSPPPRFIKADDAARTPAPTAPARREWSMDRCTFIGPEGCGLEHLLEGEADILFLGKLRWISVSAAVAALNEGSLVAEGGVCIVFSQARRAYQLIWRSDKDSELTKLFPTLSCQHMNTSSQLLPGPEGYQVFSSQQPASSSVSPSRSHSKSKLVHPLLSALPPRINPAPRVVAPADDQSLTPAAKLSLDNALWPDRLGSPSRRFSATPGAVAQMQPSEVLSQMNAYHALEIQEPAQGGLGLPGQMGGQVPTVGGPVDHVSARSMQVLEPVGPVSRMIYELLPPGALQDAAHEAAHEAARALPEVLALRKLSQDFIVPHHPALSPSVAPLDKSSAPAPANEAGGGVDVVDLHFADDLDLMQPALQAQLFNKLELGPDSTIEELAQHGGLNHGVWSVRDSSVEPSRHLILKLVQTERQEGELLAKLAREQPSLVLDPALAFPVKIIKCIGKGGSTPYDLIAMRKSPGSNLSVIIGNMWWSNQASALMKIIEKVGTCLAEFHQRHDNNQHGDFQPSNIFYDEAEGRITFIDLVGIGPEGSYLDNDVEHFLESLRLMSKAYGPDFLEDSQKHFQSGYANLRSP